MPSSPQRAGQTRQRRNEPANLIASLPAYVAPLTVRCTTGVVPSTMPRSQPSTSPTGERTAAQHPHEEESGSTGVANDGTTSVGAEAGARSAGAVAGGAHPTASRLARAARLQPTAEAAALRQKLKQRNRQRRSASRASVPCRLVLLAQLVSAIVVLLVAQSAALLAADRHSGADARVLFAPSPTPAPRSRSHVRPPAPPTPTRPPQLSPNRQPLSTPLLDSLTNGIAAVFTRAPLPSLTNRPSACAAIGKAVGRHGLPLGLLRHAHGRS